MAFCENCGKKLEDGARFCGECGTLVDAEETPTNNQPVGHTQPKVQNMVQQVKNVGYDNISYTAQEAQSGKVMGVLAYFGILVLIPLFAEKENRFVRFHVNQGVILLAASAIAMFAGMMSLVFASISIALMLLLQAILGIISLMIGVFSIIGIVNVIGGKAKPIPVLGNIRLIKK